MSKKSENYLKIFFDGGSRGNPGPSASAFIIYDSNGNKLHEDKKHIGHATNNVAEYKALSFALDAAGRFKIKKVIIYTDSKLVCSQVKGLWKVKNENIALILNDVLKKLSSYEAVDIRLIPRSENSEADKLVNEELDSLNKSKNKINFKNIID